MDSDKLALQIKNVGGIESDSIKLSPGINVLSGENATNRTSIINAVMAGMGSDRPSIRTGAEEGTVILQYDGKTFERTVLPSDEGSVWKGEGLVDDVDDFHLFSCLLRSNEFRQAVVAGDDIYDLVMQPVDTDQIENKIEKLKNERENIKQSRSNLEKKKDKREKLQNDIEKKETQVKEMRKDLEAIQDKIESIDTADTQSGKMEKADKLNDDLRKITDRKNDLEDTIKRKQKQLEAKSNELESIQSSDYKDTPELKERERQINEELSNLQKDIQQLESDKSELTPLRRALNRLADSTTAAEEINRIARNYHGDDILDKSTSRKTHPTDDLVETDPESICLLCGNEIDKDRYKKMLDDVNDIITSISDKHDNVRSVMDDLREEKEEINSKIEKIKRNKNRIEELTSEIETLESEIEETESELQAVNEEQAELETKIEEMKEEVVEQTEDKTSELSSLKSEQTQKQLKIENIEREISSDESDIQQLEDEINSIESEVTERLPEINSRLEDLKGRIESTEQNVVQEFNDRMSIILDKLEYDSIERIWIEKSYKNVREGRSKREKPTFNLNVAREIDGSITSDVVKNLSESEQVVTSLIFAFTGYIVHNVEDDSPIILLDSVEMIDAGRLEELLRYITNNVEYLLVASLPEDTESMCIDSGVVIERPQPAD
jgi:predicted  nucleic acid-binding Zn-ribbon protein